MWLKHLMCKRSPPKAIMNWNYNPSDRIQIRQLVISLPIFLRVFLVWEIDVRFDFLFGRTDVLPDENRHIRSGEIVSVFLSKQWESSDTTEKTRDDNPTLVDTINVRVNGLPTFSESTSLRIIQGCHCCPSFLRHQQQTQDGLKPIKLFIDGDDRYFHEETHYHRRVCQRKKSR